MEGLIFTAVFAAVTVGFIFYYAKYKTLKRDFNNLLKQNEEDTRIRGNIMDKLAGGGKPFPKDNPIKGGKK